MYNEAQIVVMADQSMAKILETWRLLIPDVPLVLFMEESLTLALSQCQGSLLLILMWHSGDILKLLLLVRGVF